MEVNSSTSLCDTTEMKQVEFLKDFMLCSVHRPFTSPHFDTRAVDNVQIDLVEIADNVLLGSPVHG